MAINLTKFNFQEDLTSQTFNQKLTEIQTHLNNLSSANERLIRENQELRQLLNNKVEKSNINGTVICQDMNNIDIPITFFNGNALNRPSFMFDGILITGKYGSVKHVSFQFAFGIGIDQLPKIATRYKNTTWSNWIEK